MEVDKEKQARAMAKARQSLLQAEIKREEARMNQSAALFLQGQFDMLLNDEFVESMAAHILRLYRGDQRRKAITLLDKLEQSICNPSIPIRERSLMVIMILSEHTYQNNIRELSSVIARISANWLYSENDFISGFEPVCLKLQRLIAEMLTSEQWYEVEQLIVTISRISNKTLPKSNLIHGVVARVHDQLADPHVLDILTNAYLNESSQRKDVVENILINMGRQGSRFLIQRLAYSNDKEERLALIDLIPRIGSVSVPVLTDYIEDPQQPWYVVRNIVMIIARLGNNDLYSSVEPLLAHEDIRVQQQVLNCIEVLGGESMKERLLAALEPIGDDLKAHLVDLLDQFRDSDIEAALLDLFEKRDSFSSHVHDFLIAKLCRKLAHYPSSETIQTLLSLIEERKQRYGDNDNLVRAATNALRLIDQNTSGEPPRAPTDEQDQFSTLMENEVLAQLSSDSDNGGESYTVNGLSDIFVETLTDTLTSRKHQDPEHDVETNFEPPQSQDHHLTIWSGFYERLETNEANAFFATLEPMTLEAGEILVQQGDALTDLIFIDHGYADISRPNEGNRQIFAPLQAGDLIGCENFFDGLPWNLNLAAQTEVQVRLLKKEPFTELTKELPGIAAGLESFCRVSDVLPTLTRRAVEEPLLPSTPTIEVHGSAIFNKVDGEADGGVTARLAHPGNGGFNIVISNSGMDKLRNVVGHQVSAELAVTQGSTSTCFALVAGVGYYTEAAETLFMHIKFYHPVEEDNYTCKSIHIM